MSSDMSKAFHEGDVESALEELYKDVEDLRETFDVESGPSIKYHAITRELESLFRYMLDYEVKKTPKVKTVTTGDPLEYHVSVTLEDGTLKEYNLSELLKYADLDKIVLTSEDMKKYVKFLNMPLKEDRKPRLPVTRKVRDENGEIRDVEAVEFPTPEDFANNQKKHNDKTLDSLSYAEKLAINIYTTEYYSTMNGLLRGRVDPNIDAQEALIHCILCASGLDKVPNVPIEQTDQSTEGTIRVGAVFDTQELKSMAEMVDQSPGSAVTVERGFISTSSGGWGEKVPKPGEVRILFTEAPSYEPNLESAPNFIPEKDKPKKIHSGLMGKQIAALSRHPNEKELLIKSPKILWKKHKEIDGVHYFHAVPVRTPTLSANEKLEAEKVFQLEAGLEEKQKQEALKEKQKAEQLKSEKLLEEQQKKEKEETERRLAEQRILEREQEIKLQKERQAAREAKDREEILKAREKKEFKQKVEITLEKIKNIESVYNKKRAKIFQSKQRKKQILELVTAARHLSLDASLSPDQKLEQINIQLQAVLKEIDSELKTKNEFGRNLLPSFLTSKSNATSRTSRLKTIIEAIHPDLKTDPKKPSP